MSTFKLTKAYYVFGTPNHSSYPKDPNNAWVVPEIEIYVGDIGQTNFLKCGGTLGNNTPIPPGTTLECELGFHNPKDDWRNMAFESVNGVKPSINWYHGNSMWQMRRELVLEFQDGVTIDSDGKLITKYITVGGPTRVETLQFLEQQQTINDPFIPRMNFTYERRLKGPIIGFVEEKETVGEG